MREGVHNKLARFRISEALWKEAAQTARHDGMTLSEFIRSAMRREIRLSGMKDVREDYERFNHDQTAHFRINGELLQAADERARQNGMAFSEMMRAALRRELQNDTLGGATIRQPATGEPI